ncbi:MAG TPA: hypothetical protein VF587_03565 [Solirubrobacteraceae bacterium]|jgi:hypothetical protein
MSTGVGTHAGTNVRTAVHLTDAIMGTFQDILAHLGLGVGYLNRHWAVIEEGLTTWIAEGSLEDVRLECGDPSNADAVFRVPLSYRVSGAGDITFVTSQARLARALAKYESLPVGTAYRVVVSHRWTPSHVDGWSDTTAADTSGMSSYHLGGVGSGPDASASLTYHARGI